MVCLDRAGSLLLCIALPDSVGGSLMGYFDICNGVRIGSMLSLSCQPAAMCALGDLVILLCGTSLVLHSETLGLRSMLLTESWIALDTLEDGRLIAASVYQLFVLDVKD